MEREPDAKLLRIFIGEMDKYKHQPLYEVLLLEARKQKMAGCTVLRGILSFGASSVIHKAKLIEISQDLPMVVEVVDREKNIHAFMKRAGKILEDAGCGGLITIEKAMVLHYKARKKNAFIDLWYNRPELENK